MSIYSRRREECESVAMANKVTLTHPDAPGRKLIVAEQNAPARFAKGWVLEGSEEEAPDDKPDASAKAPSAPKDQAPAKRAGTSKAKAPAKAKPTK